MIYDIEKTGERIRKLRKQRGITQQRLANDLQMHEKSISKAERGVSSLSIDHLIDLAEYFSVSVDYLVRGVKDINDISLQGIYGEKDEDLRKAVEITKVIMNILKGA